MRIHIQSTVGWLPAFVKRAGSMVSGRAHFVGIFQIILAHLILWAFPEQRVRG
ncbi:MAG: hypothetical protein JNN07_11995 [Verrucomicrobiales bacterium]|nr:hypothetical protein [Verrucomicrobiales bacterium]